jgi:cysteine desulfurase
LDAARDTLAGAIGAASGEIYFTSGGTEADNTALLGVLLALREKGSKRNHVVVSAIEHHAVLDCALFAETLGFSVTVVPCDTLGYVAPEVVAEAVTDKTALVSLMHANNEVGTIQPLAEIAAVAHERGALLHTDAVQSFPYLSVNVTALGADLLSVSSHKIYGPKGVGALYVKKGVSFVPCFHGGSQEREKRPGTENVPGIIGFGKAVELLQARRDDDARHTATLRDALHAQIRATVPKVVLNGHPMLRLPNNLNLSFPDTDSETLLVSLDLHGVAVSAGSACASGSIEPSHVLKALDLPPEIALSAVRFSVGRPTTVEEVATVADIVAGLLKAK